MFSFTKMKNKQRDYQTVFNSVEGKKVLADLMDFCHMTKPTYVAGDQYQTAYNEGMRRVALRISSLLNMDEASIRRLMKLNNIEEEDQ